MWAFPTSSLNFFLFQTEQHVCNAIFIHNSKSVAMERELKRYTKKCVVYSLSDKHKVITIDRERESNELVYSRKQQDIKIRDTVCSLWNRTLARKRDSWHGELITVRSWSMKFRIWLVSSDARDPDAVDLAYFTVVQVHKLRYDSINIFYDGSQHIKSLFTKSPFDDANLATCQVYFPSRSLRFTFVPVQRDLHSSER